MEAQRHGRTATAEAERAAARPATPTGPAGRGGPLAALDETAFSARLKDACVKDRRTTALRAEVLRRTAAGTMSLRDLRMVLLVAVNAEDWAPVREAAIARITRNPETARALVQLHTQLEMWPPAAFPETDDTPAVTPIGPGAFTARARIGLPGYEITGPARRGTSRQRARDKALTSLLALLSATADPLAHQTTIPHPRPAGLGGPGLGMDAFELLLEDRLTAPEPGPVLLQAILERAGRSQFQHRHMYALLFEAHGPGWEQARIAMLDTIAQISGYASALLGMRAKNLNCPVHGFDEQRVSDDPDSGWEITGRFDPGTGLVRGAPQHARGRKAGRHRAAASLLAALTRLPEPQVRLSDAPDPHKSEAPATGTPAIQQHKKTNALMDLNQLKLDQIITVPEWASEFTGTPQQPETTVTLTCTCAGEPLQAVARARSKAEARPAAAAVMLGLVADARRRALTASEPAQPPSGLRAQPPRPEGPEPPNTSMAPPVPAELPTTPPDTARSAIGAVTEALAMGCALTLATPRESQPCVFLLYRPDAAPMPDWPLPSPLSTAAHELALACDEGARRATVTGWLLPVETAVHALLDAEFTAAAHPSARAWATAARLGLYLIAARLVYPALDDAGFDTWRIGPLPAAAQEAADNLAASMPPHAHCQLLDSATEGPLLIAPAAHALEEFLHLLAATFLRTPGGEALFGPGPWTAPHPSPVPRPALQPWADDIEDRLDTSPRPNLTLTIQAPTDTDADSGRLRTTLLLDGPASETTAEPGHGRRVRRALRRAAALWPPAARLAHQQSLSGMQITVREALALAAASPEALAAEAGLRLQWPPDLTDALTTRTVVGTRTTADGTRLGLAQLVDFRWQLALNGQALTETEMDLLAEAARPLVRLRGTWLLLDEATARRAANRHLTALTSTDALGAALTGNVSIDGTAYPCEPADGFAQLVATLRASRADSTLLPVPPRLTAELRPYQHRGLTWLARITDLGYGAVLADDMGLGKTLTAIALTLHRQRSGSQQPTLVIARASLVTNWVREIEKFAPGIPVIAFHGPGRTLDHLTPDAIVVTTYGILQRDTHDLTAIDWDLVLVDEAQSVKNPTTAAARRLRELKTAARVAITGTPVENRLDELWAIMDWANPGLLGTRGAFRNGFGRHAERDTSGKEAHQLSRLIAPFLLRRLKSDPHIAPDLPDKVHSQQVVQLTREQAALYEAAVREALDTIKASRGPARRGLVVRLLTALRQICNHPAHYLRQPGPQQGPDAAKFAARSAKLTALDDLVDQIAVCGESTLIFTSYVAMGDLLHAHLAARGHTPEFLHGSTPLTARQQLVDSFQAGDTRTLILSVKAAGVGLNLTRATHVVHYDKQWNPAVEDQATDRAHRIGQTRTVTVHQLISEATLEDRITALLQHKRSLTDAVLSSGENALADLDDHDLAELVALGSSR